MRMPRIVTSLMRIDPVVIIFAVLFMAVYSAVVLYMVGPQSDCLSVSDFTAQLQRYELRLNAAGLLHKLSSIQTENDVDRALSDGDKMTDIEVGHGDRQRRNASRSDEASSARFGRVVSSRCTHFQFQQQLYARRTADTYLSLCCCSGRRSKRSAATSFTIRCRHRTYSTPTSRPT